MLSKIAEDTAKKTEDRSVAVNYRSDQRLYGIDLFKCVAILGVIFLHTEYGTGSEPEIWLSLKDISKLAVPYFLSASFFLSIQSCLSRNRSFNLWQRLKRLLIPYVFWTGVYLIFNFFLYTYKGDYSDFELEFLTHPEKIVFLGGASFHLWFIPLILSGTILLKAGERFIKSFSSNFIFGVFFVSVLLYGYLDISENGFDIGSNTAFYSLLSQQFLNEYYGSGLRVITALLALAIQCLPYLAFSALVVKARTQRYLWEPDRSLLVAFVFWLLFGLVCVFSRDFLPDSISEVLKGCGALLAALVIPTRFIQSRLIVSLSNSAYGIYFIHWMVICIFFFAANKIAPQYFVDSSTLGLICASIFILIVSWSLVHLLSKLKIFRFVALGDSSA